MDDYTQEQEDEDMEKYFEKKHNKGGEMVKVADNRIGVQEKRELAHIITEEYNRIITDLTQEMKFTEGEILDNAREKFGLAIIDKKIQQLKAEIELYEKKKRELGFDSYGNFVKKYLATGEGVDTTTPAGRFYALKVKRTADVIALNRERDRKLKDLWLRDNREEVKKLLSSEVKIQMIEKKEDK